MRVRQFVMMCCCIGAATFAESLSTKEIMELPYEVLEEIPDIKLVEQNDFKEIILPAMPVKPGKIRVLRGRFVSYAKTLSGCNTAMKIEFNNTALGRITASGDERMLCKNSFFVLNNYPGCEFGYFTGNNMMLPFAPTVDANDAGTEGNNGSMILLDLEDVAIGVDGNSIRITNVREHYMNWDISLIGQDISIGYLDKSAIPAPPGADVTYDGVENSIVLNGIRLDVGKAGGFAVAGEKGEIYLVESKLSMPFNTPFELNASDEMPEKGPLVSIEKSGKYGYVIKAKWDNGVELYRRLTIEQDGLIHWLDDWKNGSNAIIGIPFHHRVRLVGNAIRTIIAGNGDTSSLSSPDSNPTIAILNRKNPEESGIGISEDNDIARLLGSVKAANDGTEIYSANFALAPGCSQPMNYSIDIFAKGGYWKYINRLRKRWQIGKITAPYPFFFGANYNNVPGATAAERIKNAFAQLGPVAVATSPWRRFDTSVVCSNRYPKLAEGEERVPGGCPDLDVDEFVSFKHRREFDRAMAEELKLFHENAPNVKYVVMTHPAMEEVYLPMADRWPYAENAIHDANGNLFHSPTYDRAHLGDYVNKGWVVGYYAPYGGTRYYDLLVDDIRRCLDIGVDGIYIDELSFGLHRDYSRYDYGRWDGFSADLDENGNVKKLKYDVALASEGLQNAAISITREKGKFFLGNGSPALRSVNNSQALRFWEGGNGAATLGYSHLSHVPLAFGNYGNVSTLAGVLACVRDALRAGCIYSPYNCNTVLKDAENCVSKQYPITVEEIYSGFVIGKERLVTISSGTFEWACAPEGAKVEMFIYGADGERIPNEGDAPVIKDGKITIEVPDNGLAIAELVLNN